MTLREALSKGMRGDGLRCARYAQDDIVIEVQLLPSGECRVNRVFWGTCTCSSAEVDRVLASWWDVPVTKGWEPA